jgi:hypothetical protein
METDMKTIIIAAIAITLAGPASAFCISAHTGNEQRPAVGSLDKAGAKLCGTAPTFPRSR